MNENLILREENIASIIHMIRGEKVMLDMDLAILYGMQTRLLKQAVRRNIQRFPSDFMFELTRDEYNSLRSQIVTLENLDNFHSEMQITSPNENDSQRGKYSKFAPFAFTEQGVAMLSGILNSERAISVNIAIMRTFVQMRKLVFSNAELGQRVNDLQKLMTEHLDDYSSDIQDIYEALRQMMTTQEQEGQPRRTIGF